MSEALAYRFVSDSDKSQVADKLISSLKIWARNWFQSSLDIRLEWKASENISTFSKERWLFFGELPDLWVAWKLDGIVTRELLGMMFNTPVGASVKPTPLMQDILQECVANLVHEISNAAAISPISAVETITFESLRLNQGSGFLLSELGGDIPRQTVAFGGELIERILDKAPIHPSKDTLAQRKSMIGKYKANLTVIAGKAELTLRDLTGLEVGDVIRLNTLVKEPFAVLTREGAPVAKAHLGVQGNHKAIQLIED